MPLLCLCLGAHLQSRAQRSAVQRGEQKRREAKQRGFSKSRSAGQGARRRQEAPRAAPRSCSRRPPGRCVLCVYSYVRLSHCHCRVRAALHYTTQCYFVVCSVAPMPLLYSRLCAKWPDGRPRAELILTNLKGPSARPAIRENNTALSLSLSLC